MGSVGPGERGDDGDENGVGEDAESAFMDQAGLQQPGEVGANVFVRRHAILGSRLVQHGSHECLHGTT